MNRGHLHKHAQVVKANKINTRLQNTEQLVKRMLNVPDAGKKQPAPQDEDELMASINNLDMLLANMQSKDGKDAALKKLSDNYGIVKPPSPKYQQPFLVPDPEVERQIKNQQQMQAELAAK